MAEVLGIVASVATLIETADFVRRTLGDYRKGGKDRERLLAEVESLSSVLNRLKTDNDNAKRLSKQEPWLDIVGQLSAVGGTFEQIDDVISEVKLKVERKQGLRGAIVHWTWPFVKEDVDRNVRQMQRLSHHVSVVLQDASLKLTLAINESVTRVDKTTNRRELRAILEWLSSLYFLEQQRLEYLKAFPGTCDWFLKSAEYSEWKQKKQRVLYCSAIGGAGKTILASAAIDDLRMQTAGQDTAILVIYCKHDRPDTHAVDKLAMTMLRQLVQIKACRIPPDLEELLERHFYTNETRPSLEEVLKILNAHLPTFSGSFVVVDGLDEIMDEAARESIIAFLMKLEGAPQVMFTSRPIDLIEKMFLSIYSEDQIDLNDDHEGESDDPADDDNEEAAYQYDHDDSSEEEDSSEGSSNASSDQEGMGVSPEEPSVLFQSFTRVAPDMPFYPEEDDWQHKDEAHKVCGKCGNQVGLLQYHCRQCYRNRSVICVSCYDSGTRCVNGDNSHDTCVGARIPCLTIDVSARPRAIRRYVRRRTQQSAVLTKFVNLKPGFAEEIEDVVTHAAQKMFLLAQLHMDALSSPDLLKFSEVRKALENLPTGLNDSYDNAMKRIQGHGRSLLRLVAYAQRPLNVREVEHALALMPTSNEILDDEIIPAGTLISRCAGLLTLDENHEVVFSHYTIVGYFAEQSKDLFGSGHKYMAELSLSYLNLEPFQQGPVHGMEEASEFDARIRAYPFFDYASVFWGVHAQASKDSEVLDVAYAFVEDDKSRSASVQALWFSIDEASASWRTRSDGSPLQIAMFFNYQALGSRLLGNGMNADIQDTFGMTPLMWSAQAGNSDMMKTFIRTKVPLNAFNGEGRNALHIAILHHREEVAMLLLDQSGLDINAPAVGGRGSWKFTPLMLAAYEEELSVVRKLLNRTDILVNFQDTYGQTALHRVARMGNIEVMRAIANAPSVDLGLRDDSGCPALTLASLTGNLAAVKALLDAGADVNVRESPLYSLGTALMRAADYDAVYVVHELIRRGIDWNAKDAFGRTAVHSAAINGSDRVMAVLLDLPGIEIDPQDSNGNTPIHDAAALSFESSVLKLLLIHGASTSIRNNRGKTPLDSAKAIGTRKTVRILKEKYADDFGMPKRSMTGMSMEEPTLPQAVAQGDEAAITSILSKNLDDKSIDLEEKDDWLGRTPLQLAADVGHLRIVKKLHLAGADINVQDKYGRTALHIAALRFRMSIARYLLRNHADMTKRDKWGVGVMEDASPTLQILLLQHGIVIAEDTDIQYLLFLAAEQGNMKAVKRVIDAGADVQVKDSYGCSPYERAKQAGKADVARYLDHVGKSAAASGSHLNTPNTSSDSIYTLRAASSANEDLVDRSELDNLNQSEVPTANVHISDTESGDTKSSGQKDFQVATSPTENSWLTGGFGISFVDFRNYIIVFLCALTLGLYLK